MTAQMNRALLQHAQQKCPCCGSKFYSNIGNATKLEEDGSLVHTTLWACGECDHLWDESPKACITGCGFIDHACKCVDTSVGTPRLEVRA